MIIAAQRRARLLTLVLAISMLSGCAGPTPSASHESSSPTAAPAPVEQMVDVGGHRLYLSCAGTGSPTVVYVHGWVEEQGYTPHHSANAISQLLAPEYRVCLYDRRNTGGSQTVNAVQTPDDTLHDMEAVLTKGGVEPPYILMAASFGGLVAYDFLSHHPDQVSGVVFLDAIIPDELALDRYLAPEDTFLRNRDTDMCCSQERISQYDLINSLQQYIGHEPAIPMIYLAAALEPRVEYSWTTPAYDARYPVVLQGFVNRFSPGELRSVDAHHFMEPEIPDRIAHAVQDVAKMASAK